MAWLGLGLGLAVGGAAAQNITMEAWQAQTKCQGPPDRVAMLLPGECVPLVPFAQSGVKTWIRAQCEEVTGFFWDVQVDVVLRQYGDHRCDSTAGQGPPVRTQQDTCFEVPDKLSNAFVEDIRFSCNGVVPPRDDDSWPVPGMSLLAAAVLFMCLFGQCQAQARARARARVYRPRVGGGGRRGSLNAGMYDPSEHVGYGSVQDSAADSDDEEGSRRGADGGGRAVVAELSPAAKELVKEHEESGADAPTMQQITQMVLRAKSVPPTEKRHTMMLLFRHWGYAGGQKPPASDHPTTSRQRSSERDDVAERSTDVEAPAAVQAGSVEVDAETPLLQGSE